MRREPILSEDLPAMNKALRERPQYMELCDFVNSFDDPLGALVFIYGEMQKKNPERADAFINDWLHTAVSSMVLVKSLSPARLQLMTAKGD